MSAADIFWLALGSLLDAYGPATDSESLSMTATLSTPITTAVFPIGTTDTEWSFAVSGTLADGSAYSNTFTSASPSMQAALPEGATVALVVSRNGVSSLPSDPFVAPVTTVTLSVPDATQKAVISAS